jgi:hypothetical protein
MTTLAYRTPPEFVSFGAINDECLPPRLRPSAIGQPPCQRPSIEQVAAPQHSADTALAGKGAADDVSVVAAQPLL